MVPVIITTCIEYDGKKYDVVCKSAEAHDEWLGSMQRYIEKTEKEKALVLDDDYDDQQREDLSKSESEQMYEERETLYNY